MITRHALHLLRILCLTKSVTIGITTGITSIIKLHKEERQNFVNGHILREGQEIRHFP